MLSMSLVVGELVIYFSRFRLQLFCICGHSPQNREEATDKNNQRRRVFPVWKKERGRRRFSHTFKTDKANDALVKKSWVKSDAWQVSWLPHVFLSNVDQFLFSRYCRRKRIQQEETRNLILFFRHNSTWFRYVYSVTAPFSFFVLLSCNHFLYLFVCYTLQPYF